ncbi:MAG: alpha/beta hydrolase [Rhodospirillaceae bacterium]|jgi:pimeloyl-ACP methyl ester carboxylesterase|nr:alpha/beta hydrolase [Rhodospirillaceae bacterium]MBT6138112.1 alpha/beta hydrolase [Rhodospirillaceae bacterium]
MLKIDGRTIDYEESGEGPTVLFVPGSFSTPMAWRSIQKRLPQKYRFVSTSLCGYGETEETRSLGDLGMEHQIRVIEAVAKQTGGPVHLVGHSFGGTLSLAVALEGALAGVVEVLSIATFEANPLALIGEHGGAELLAATQRMSGKFEAAYHSGDPDAAGQIIDFWGGAGSFAAMPEGVREYCRATAYANVLDWRTAYEFQAQKVDYAGLSMPVLIVRGGLANPAMVAISEALSASIPSVVSADVEGASHFLITSHADECAELLAEFLGKNA